MNTTQESYDDNGIYAPTHRITAHAPRSDSSLVAIEQAVTAEAALQHLAEFVARHGNTIRQIRFEGVAEAISIERARTNTPDALGCEIVVVTASKRAQLTMNLARRPSAGERRRFEMAGHKAVLRAEECVQNRPDRAHLPSLCNVGCETYLGDFRSDLVGNSAPMKRLAGAIRKLAPLNSTVLILGETGTGKELVARAIHQNSLRADKPFVAVNCNSLTETIFDSQLMGHVRGAFTGAQRDERGAIRAAAGGTLFLDEIGDVPLSLQGKLLRVLQERVVTPVGTHKEYKVDVRFVAATNKDLEREVREGRFRDDLYQRLRVQEVITTPLRERLGDIPELVKHFQIKLPAEMNLSAPPMITNDAIHALCRHHWPGNVRELENAMNRLLARNSPGELVNGEEVMKELGMSSSVVTHVQELPRVTLPAELSEWCFTEESLDRYAKRVRAAMLWSLEVKAGGAEAAAQWLGIRTKMYYQLRQRVNEAAGQVLNISRGYINSNNLRTRKREQR